VLADLYAGALEDAKARLKLTSLARIEQLASEQPPALDAIGALRGGSNIKVLAEIKRASPSKGDLSDIADPVELAQTYQRFGAAAISVLTEERKFKGSLADLAAVRKAVTVPLLRKDFIANEQQILEARAVGADIVLLIVAGLDQRELERLARFTEQLGMTPFVETHSHDEVLRALDAGAQLVGVNARDLSTFETDRDLFARLAHLLPADVVKVAESAVRDVADVERYAAAGADVVLVGEALVTNDAARLLADFTSVLKA
jgi:indole-3-glycerol phosphate synthase